MGTGTKGTTWRRMSRAPDGRARRWAKFQAGAEADERSVAHRMRRSTGITGSSSVSRVGCGGRRARSRGAATSMPSSTREPWPWWRRSLAERSLREHHELAMRAMAFARPAPVRTRPLSAVDRPDPTPGAAELLVRVRVCAVCRTDLHILEGDLPPRRLPLVPGHQIVGVVAARGPGCRRFDPGDRVGIAWLRGTCGTCRVCREGRENLCPASVYTGYDADGGYAELAVVPEAFAYRVPAAFRDREAAPLLCAGIIGYRALSRSQLPPTGRLGLYGFGSSAHVVLQLARHRGAEVF